MNEGLIPRRYAKALYKVALERKCDRQMYTLMQNLTAAFAANDRLQTAVANPFVANADKDALLTTAAGAGAQDKTFADFLKLLAENHRIDFAAQIARSYVDIYRLEHHIHRVEVVSAAPLAPEVLDRIKQMVQQQIGQGTMEFSTDINPALIGGFIVNIDNERLDASLSTQFNELRRGLLN